MFGESVEVYGIRFCGHICSWFIAIITIVVVPAGQLTIIIIGFVIAFALAFGLGANDVANSFGTSVGSRVLTLKMACVLASICELSGAILLGARVSNTIRKEIIDLNQFNQSKNGISLLILGQISALASCCVWLLLATFFKLPVSATHSIVGSTLGYSLIPFGFSGINWKTVINIVASWFISPAFSGCISVIVFLIIKRLVLVKEQPLEPALMTLPFLYGITIAINVFSILHGALHTFNVRIPMWGYISGPIIAGMLTGILVYVFVVPYMRERVRRKSQKKERVLDSSDSYEAFGMRCCHCLKAWAIGSHEKKIEQNAHNQSGRLEESRKLIEDRPEEARVFAFAQILTAMFGSFAHGGNDVSNAIGPLVGLWIIVTTGEILSRSETPIWLLFYGGAGITVGLWLWGRRVIETIGDDLTKITPSSGVSIELGAALTVLIASKFGLPISTTHCKVGSVVCVGFARARENVNWRLFAGIVFAWIVTVPISAGLSALMMKLLTLNIDYK